MANKCISCGKNVANDTSSTTFPCPGCKEKQITRCSSCKKRSVKYTCKCGFVGP